MIILSSASINNGLGNINPSLPTPPTIDGYPQDWPTYTSSHPHVVVDGLVNDWYTEVYPISDYRVFRNVTTSNNPYDPYYVWDYGNGNKYLYYHGEFIWFDALDDQNGTTAAYTDITELRVTSNESHLLMLVRFRDLGILGGGITNPSVAIVIALDTDMNYRNGNRTLADGKTLTSPYAPWDYEVLIDLSNPDVSSGKPIYGDGVAVDVGGSPLDIYNASYYEVSTKNSVFVADSTTESVEIAIAWSDIGVANTWNVSNVRVYLGVFVSNGYGDPAYSPSSKTSFVDVLSDIDTDTELSDGELDYWLDIGFNNLPEPVYYGHRVLDAEGYIQAWSDVSNDMRTDYIPNEAFDLDLLSIELWRDDANGELYVLVHIRGLVAPEGNATPMVALVFDTTPANETDGYDSWIYAPTGIGDTDTELGGVTRRNSTWNYIVWLNPRTGTITILNGTRQIVLTGQLAYSHHFIEAAIPLSFLPNLPVSYRLEVQTYALVNPGSPLASQPGFTANKLIDLTGSNAYDTLAYYPTWGMGVDQTYTIDGEFYDTDNDVTNDLSTGTGDHWIDSYTLIKYATRIVNITLHHISYDNDSYIEIGEPAWITARVQYYNGTGWAPLYGVRVRFYLYGSLIYLGSNTTNRSGYVYLWLGDIASNPDILSGRYRVYAVYDPPLTYSTTSGEYSFSSAENYSTSVYIIIKRPFISSLPEPPYTSILLAATLLTLIILLRRRYSGSRY